MMQDEASASQPGAPADGLQRLDKWLWFARLIKSRTQAAQLVTDGKVRVNRTRTTKPSQAVRAGDVLTVALRGRVFVWKVLAPGERRGPPPEARALYEDLTPPAPPRMAEPAQAERERGSGRPTKRDRRQIHRLIDEN